MSIYESAYSPEDFFQPHSSITDSIYHSFYEGHPHKNQTGSLYTASRGGKGTLFSKLLSCDRQGSWERYQRRLLAAAEELVSAHLSIDEVLLCLSSNGTQIL